jgi:hypothetical protein
MPGFEDDGADVADEDSDEVGSETDTGSDESTGDTEETSGADESESGSGDGEAPGYCCTCEDGCWHSAGQAACVGYGEWFPSVACEVTPAAVIDCSLDCPVLPSAACCTCPASDDPEVEFQCWEWTQGVEPCEVAQANALGEETHWCDLDSEGYPTACLAAC